jgi:hypothetical protein
VTDFWTREDQELHERVMARARSLSPEEIFAIAVHAGIYTPEGELTPPYRDDEPHDASASE